MTEIFARDYGIIAGNDVTTELLELLRSLSGKKGVTLTFDEGEYFIDSTKCAKDYLYITNSTAADEWFPSETPHLCNIVLYFKDLEDFTLSGNGAVFNIDGRVTNVVVEGCKGITLEGFSLKVKNPDMHELTVIKQGAFYVDFELDAESRYEADGSGFNFLGKEYKTSFTDRRASAFWIGHLPAGNNDDLRRVPHPFLGAYRITELKPYVFRAKYIFKRRMNVGERFYLYDNRRKNAGIFVSRSRDVTVKNVTQHFNYGLAFVAQDTENITLNGAKFMPERSDTRLMASVADFIQICMCKGLVTVKNCYFEGAGDDCLNVHGVHYKITEINENLVTVKYCHSQTFGYNPLHAGDEIEYVNPKTLLPVGKARIERSEMLDGYTIRLAVSNTGGAKEGIVIEDITMCPDLVFADNVLNRIITRGLLITTRGKVLVENNHFVSTAINSILFSDDAKNWYESGRVTDVTICGNTFDRCPEYTVCIKPENANGNEVVHGNFVIEDNVINCNGRGFYFRCAKKVILNNNTKVAINSQKTVVSLDE